MEKPAPKSAEEAEKVLIPGVRVRLQPPPDNPEDGHEEATILAGPENEMILVEVDTPMDEFDDRLRECGWDQVDAIIG